MTDRRQLKCSGEKDGCVRCLAQNLSCQYDRAGSRASRRMRGHSSRTPEGSHRSASNSPGSSTGRPNNFSSTKTGERQTANRKSSNTSPVSTVEDCLSDFDMSLLSPEDGFEFDTSLTNSQASVAAAEELPMMPTSQSHLVLATSPYTYNQWNPDEMLAFPFGEMTVAHYPTSVPPIFVSNSNEEYSGLQDMDPHYWSGFPPYGE